jgi:hypothetical protein
MINLKNYSLNKINFSMKIIKFVNKIYIIGVQKKNVNWIQLRAMNKFKKIIKKHNKIKLNKIKIF